MPIHVDDRIWLPSATRGIDPARVTIVTTPTVEPVSVDEFREFVRVDAKSEARTLGLVLKAARSYFERMTGLALVSQAWRAEFDELPRRPGVLVGTSREIELPRAPMLALTDIKYKPDGYTGTLSTFSSASYSSAGVGMSRSFPRVWLNDDVDWPTLGSFPGALQITFTVGFGTNADSVPEDIRVAVMMLAAHWYENRLPLNIGNIVNELPHSLAALIEMHRVAFIA